MHAVSSQFSPTGWIAIIIPALLTRAAASSIDHDGSSLLEFVAPEVGRCIIAALIFIPVLDYYNKIAAPDLNKRLNRSTVIRCLASFIRFSILSRVAIKIYQVGRLGSGPIVSRQIDRAIVIRMELKIIYTI